MLSRKGRLVSGPVRGLLGPPGNVDIVSSRRAGPRINYMDAFAPEPGL